MYRDVPGDMIGPQIGKVGCRDQYIAGVLSCIQAVTENPGQHVDTGIVQGCVQGGKAQGFPESLNDPGGLAVPFKPAGHALVRHDRPSSVFEAQNRTRQCQFL